MKEARLVTSLSGWNGDARVYELTPPLVVPADHWDTDTAGKSFRYVIVSAADVVFSGPETYVFPAEKHGDLFDVADWGELEGSFRGALDHERALGYAGYTVVA